MGLGRIVCFAEIGKLVRPSHLRQRQVEFRPVATTLYDFLPRDETFSSDHLLGKFLDYIAGRPLTLYPAPKEAGVGVCHGVRDCGVGNRTFPSQARHVTMAP